MGDAIHKPKYMNNLIKFIENNLPDDLDIKLLSNIGYSSYEKLYREFYSLTGHSVKEYVRKRRLSNALALIKASGLSLTDIALQCGYSSHQALCRATRQTLDLTPSGYKGGDTYFFFPPFNGEPPQSVIVSGVIIPRARRILFYHTNVTNIENIAIDSFLQAFPDYDGRIFGRNGGQIGNRLCYELYLTDIGKEYNILEQYGFKVTRETPCFNATFATSTVKNNEQKINAAWNYLYSEWLQNSMFEYTGEPYFEEYLLKNSKPCKLKLYLPIRRRSEEIKITLVNNPGLCFFIARAKGFNAEKIASKAVIDYLAAHFPYIVNTLKELYVRKEINAYVCGVRINSGLRIACTDNIRNIYTNHDNYLMLESGIMGDYDRYADMLLSFAQANDIAADNKGLFAVYDAADSFDILKIKMFCPVKIRKK